MKNNPEILKHFHTLMSENNFNTFIFDTNNKEITRHPLVVFYDEYKKQVYYIQGQTFYDNKPLHVDLVNNKYFVKIKFDGTSDFIIHDTMFDCTTINICSLEDFVDKFKLTPKTNYKVLKDYEIDLINETIQFNWSKSCFSFRTISINQNNKSIDYNFMTTNWLELKIMFNQKLSNKPPLTKEESLKELQINYDVNLIDNDVIRQKYQTIINTIEYLINDYKINEQYKKRPFFTRTR